jgi:hypothetical protein
MKKLLSYLIIGMLVLGGLGAVATAKNQDQKNNQRNNTMNSPYIDELDQSMTDFDGALPVGLTNITGFYTNLSVAQSFIPQKELLTRAQFLMARNPATSRPCVLAIRDNLTHADLAITSVEPSEFPVVNASPTQENQLAWINFNFDDIWVTPGQTYYIVVYTENVTDNYYWISGNGSNIYPNGSVFISLNDGHNWSGEIFPDGDGCFKTYGLRETYLNITMNHNLFGPSFVIKNIGNYTAWDVTWNYTTSGGFLFINKGVSGNLSQLLPGNEIIVKSGFVFGFGKVTISLRVSAANVHEQLSQVDATVLLFFIIVH